MPKKTYNVIMHYNTYIAHKVEAANEEEAKEKANEIEPSSEELMSNLSEPLYDKTEITESK